MAPPFERTLQTTNHTEHRAEVDGETTTTELHVDGSLPAGLSGRLLAIGGNADAGGKEVCSPDGRAGLVHSILLHAGAVISYRSRWVLTATVAQRLGVASPPGPRNTDPDIVASNMVVFGGSILALGDGSLAHELTPELDTLRRVDLAGRSRGLAAFPKRDPISGGLHVLTVAPAGAQEHVVVSSSALTRTRRMLDDAPTRITDLAITHDRIVLAADGFVGVLPRGADARTTWITTDLDAPELVHAHDVGDNVVVYAVTPSLERWSLHASSGSMHRELLDGTPRRFARINDHRGDGPPPFVWTTGGRAVAKHDLFRGSVARHVVGPGLPGELVFITDAARAGEPDGGWLVGFVHDLPRGETDLVVVDAADLRRLAAVRIRHNIPARVRSTWVPS